MKKIILLVFLFSLTLQLFAQTDSLKILKIAEADAQHFKLDKQTWKAYRKHQVGYTSDYFKPNNLNTTHPELLTDSVFVRDFREAAYRKTTRHRTVGHYILVGGGIYIGAIVVGTIIFIIVYASGGLS